MEWLPTFTRSGRLVGHSRHRVRAVRPRRRHGRRGVRHRRREPRRRGHRCRDHARRHARLPAAARAHAARVRGRALASCTRRTTSSCSKGAALPGLVALAIASDGAAHVETTQGEPRALRDSPGRAHRAGAARGRRVLHCGRARAGRRARDRVASCAGADGASCFRPRATRCASSSRRTGHEALDRLINRNLLLAYFYGVGRALDDAHFYLVRTRTPWHGRGVTLREWESLTWTLPAVQLADAPLARELILRACEVHGYAPGSGVRYLDGTLFEPGFCLEGAASYALAVDRYIRETNDDQIVEEPVLADTLYLVARRSRARDGTRMCRCTPPRSRRAGTRRRCRTRCTATRSSRRRSTCFDARSTSRPRATCRIPRRCAPRSSATSRATRDGKSTLRVGDRSERQRGRSTTIRSRRCTGCPCTR